MDKGSHMSAHPTNMIVQPTQVHENAKFQWKQAVVVGSFQVIIGLATFGLVIAALVTTYISDCEYWLWAWTWAWLWYLYIGSTLMCPVMYFISGGMAIGSPKKQNRPYFRALLAMCILSILAAIWQVVCYALTLAYLEVDETSCDPYTSELSEPTFIAAIVTGGVELVLSIWLCILSGTGMSYVSTHQTTMLVSYGQPNTQNGATARTKKKLPKSNQIIPVVSGVSLDYPQQHGQPWEPGYGGVINQPQTSGTNRAYYDQRNPSHALWDI